MTDPIFKPCMQHQQMLPLSDISDLIDENAMIRVVERSRTPSTARCSSRSIRAVIRTLSTPR